MNDYDEPTVVTAVPGWATRPAGSSAQAYPYAYPPAPPTSSYPYPPAAPARWARRRRSPARWLLAVAALAAVLLWSAPAGWQSLARWVTERTGAQLPFVPGGSGAAAANAPVDPDSVAARVDPGVLDVNTDLGLQGAQAAGTGVALTSSGEVLTNNHVIAGATRITATDVGNGRTYQATVVGYDRGHDIAVLRLRGAAGLATVSTADSSKVRAGDAVTAIGNAGGAGGVPAAVRGTVSALDQAITATDETGGGSEQLTGLIQVDADIQPGDSGGPLVDGLGRVIGIDTAASAGFQFRSAARPGRGFAVPVNQALSIARQIEAGRGSDTVHIGATGFLGVRVQSAAGSAPSGGDDGTGGDGTGGDGIGGDASPGAAVSGVVSGSPAEQVGLVAGDTIVAVDGRAVTGPTALTTLTGRHHPGDRISVRWVDTFGQQHDAIVALATGPPA